MDIFLALLRPEILVSLLLILVVILRRPVNPRVSLHINAAPEKVFEIIDIYDGKRQEHGRSTIVMRCTDAVQKIYNFTYSSLTSNGRSRQFDAQFRLVEHVPSSRIVLERLGFDGKPTNNQLMRITHDVVPDGNGSRLTTTYNWGPRLLIAQLLARADLWGGAYRIKGLAETGVANERAYNVISVAMLVVTALISVVAFGAILGLSKAAAIIFVLFVHEIGHLLAYRVIGQPWGRMVFLPFLGAMAIPRLPFESQWQVLFAALMGPGFSILLAVGCIVLAGSGSLPQHMVSPVLLTGLITSIINLFNLVPVEPLDGGVALRSILARISASWARAGLLSIGLVIGLLGFLLEMPFLMVFAIVAILFNLKPRQIDVGLIPLTPAHFAAGVASYLAIGAAHIDLMLRFIEHPSLWQI